MKIVLSVIYKIRNVLYKINKKILLRRNSKMKLVYGVTKEKRSVPVIVSLTTYSKRINKMDKCIISILNQSVKPDRIIIWLGNDLTMDIANKYLEKYKEYGVEYYLDSKNNYLSHKKYIYVGQKFSDSYIITFDDDLVYPKNTIKSLLKKSAKYKDCVIARRVHKIRWEKEKILSYKNWRWEWFLDRKPSYDLCPTTGAGTLFPPNVFDGDIIDFNLIKTYALTADDMWLKFMIVKKRIKTVWAGNFLEMPPELEKREESLSSINNDENMNDIYIEKIMKDFNITYNDFRQ